MFEISKEQVRALLGVQRLQIPDDEIENVRVRLATWLTALQEIESVLGEEMDLVDPIPPVYPREDF